MARPRKIIPGTVGINMVELASKILKMSDAEIGAWLRKAVGDCINGCQDPDCDPFIKVQYEKSLEEMRYKQDIDAQAYRRRLASQGKILGSGKPDTVISANDQATPSAGGSCANHSATTSVITTSTDAVTTTKTTLAGEIHERCKKQAAVSLSAATPASPASDKKPYGTCGHVMLTDAEGHHLREVYGKNLATAIDILDAYIENGGKASKKYKNHAAVLRKGNWVWNKVQEMILNEKRIENASKGPKNWKAQERERNARVLRGESADGSDIVRDEDLTPEELERKYG